MLSLATRRAATVARSLASRGVTGAGTVRHMSVADRDNILPVSDGLRPFYSS